MLFSETFDLRFPFSNAQTPRPDPLQIGIVNRADLLLFQFTLNQICQLTHQGTSSFYQSRPGESIPGNILALTFRALHRARSDSSDAGARVFIQGLGLVPRRTLPTFLPFRDWPFTGKIGIRAREFVPRT